MPFDFDKIIPRRQTRSTKWDAMNAVYGIDRSDHILPMWIADMDFACAPEIAKAVQQTVELPIYGYVRVTERYFTAAKDWLNKRYGLDVPREWLSFSPSVLPTFVAAMQLMTNPGEGIIVQTPLYYPFIRMIQMNGRRLEHNKLIERYENGRLTYAMDLDNLEALAQKPDVNMMVLCNPHNPIGRAWSKEDLAAVARICQKHGVFIVADEIHSDLVFGGKTHTPLISAAPDCAKGTLSLYSPGKSFNLAGAQAAYAIIPDPGVRARVAQKMRTNDYPGAGFLAEPTLCTAYESCAYYVDELLPYLEGNIALAHKFLSERLPKARMTYPEATYLLWVDLRECGVAAADICRFLLEKAAVGIDPGDWFGVEYGGYIRVNLACPRAMLEEGLRKIADAYDAL